jgi:hypothetical protein
MFTAVPWSVFLALVVVELAIVLSVRIGWSAVGALRHRHDTVAMNLD